MKLRGVIICALSFSIGCATDGKKGIWDDFWKDLRGDNMQMRNNFSKLDDAQSDSSQKKIRE